MTNVELNEVSANWQVFLLRALQIYAFTRLWRASLTAFGGWRKRERGF